jgi:hypothetical protein
MEERINRYASLITPMIMNSEALAEEVFHAWLGFKL